MAHLDMTLVLVCWNVSEFILELACDCVCVWCAHLGNSTGRRTVTMAAPLLLTSGPVRYEAVLYSCGTSPVAGGLVLTCDSVHSCRLYSDVSVGLEAIGTMTCYPTQSYYPDTVPTSPFPILIMQSTRLASDKYKI